MKKTMAQLLILLVLLFGCGGCMNAKRTSLSQFTVRTYTNEKEFLKCFYECSNDFIALGELLTEHSDVFECINEETNGSSDVIEANNVSFGVDNTSLSDTDWDTIRSFWIEYGPVQIGGDYICNYQYLFFAFRVNDGSNLILFYLPDILYKSNDSNTIRNAFEKKWRNDTNQLNEQWLYIRI